MPGLLLPTLRRAFAVAASLLTAALLLCTASGSELTPTANSGRGPIPDSVRGIKARIAELKGQHAKSGWLEAYLYWYEQRAYPNDRIDWAAYSKGMAQAQKMAPVAFPGNRRRGAGVESQPWGWVPMGPYNIDPSVQRIYNGVGAVSGRVNGVSYGHTEGTYYLASAGGGPGKPPTPARIGLL